MKVSEPERQLTRVRILTAAVDVITIRGFKNATMREIAKQAQIGDATIYNYFASKEALLYGYCDYVQQQVRLELKAIPDFHTYSLHEQLQQLIDTELRVWLGAREYLQQVFELTFAAPVAGFNHLQSTRQLFEGMVKDLLEAAIEVGEIPEQPYQNLLPRLFWDYMGAILAYWLKDSSDGFANTTQVVDRSMELIAIVLQQALLGKVLDLASFLLRTHLLNFQHTQPVVKSKHKPRFMEDNA